MMILIEQYIQRIVSDVTLPNKLKVVVDCGNGIPGAVAPMLLLAFGLRCVRIVL